MDTKRPTNPAAEEILGRYFPVLDHGFVSLVDYMGSDEDVERAQRLDLLEDAARRDVAAHEDGFGAERTELLGSLLRCAVRAEVSNRDPRRPLAGKPQRDRLADPPRPTGDEYGTARAHRSPRGNGSEAGAADGIVSQPIRARDSGSEFSAFEEENPSRSSSSFFSSA